MTEGGILTIRPEHISGVIDTGEDWVLVLIQGRGAYEIERDQISFDCITNHTQHAGVRVLN
jgi:hypothetical protein